MEDLRKLVRQLDSTERSTFTCPTTGRILQFEVRVLSFKASLEVELSSKLPAVVHFPGAKSEKGGLPNVEKLQAISQLIAEPLLLISPLRSKGDGQKWWVLDSDDDEGRHFSSLDFEKVRFLSTWIAALAQQPGVDASRLSLSGFGAGAYAVTELLMSDKLPQVHGAVLGALHGHGSLNEAWAHGDQGRWSKMQANWAAYLQRLQNIRALPGGVYIFHCFEDQVSLLDDAKPIFAEIRDQQERHNFGLTMVQVEPAARQTRKGNNSNNDYSSKMLVSTKTWAGLLSRRSTWNPQREQAGRPPPQQHPQRQEEQLQQQQQQQQQRQRQQQQLLQQNQKLVSGRRSSGREVDTSSRSRSRSRSRSSQPKRTQEQTYVSEDPSTQWTQQRQPEEQHLQLQQEQHRLQQPLLQPVGGQVASDQPPAVAFPPDVEKLILEINTFPENRWATPFWSCPEDQILNWTDPTTRITIGFEVCVVRPPSWAEQPLPSRMPICICFGGVSSKVGIKSIGPECVRNLLDKPVVFVAPRKTKKTHQFWFLKGKHSQGWRYDEFDDDKATCFGHWITYLNSLPCVQQTNLLGFSAGSFAASEAWAKCSLPLNWVVLCGLHGHGDVSGNDELAVRHWQAQRRRLLDAPKALGVAWMHNSKDIVCPKANAEVVYETMKEGQARFGEPQFRYFEVEYEYSKKTKEKNRTYHDYFENALLMPDLWRMLLSRESE